MIKLFLGGTVGNNTWRDKFIADLVEQGVPSDVIFNPVVSDWNEAAQAAEEQAKAEAQYMMFYISDPKQEGLNMSAYSMVEATMALYDKPETAVVAFDKDSFNGHPLKAMNQTEKVLKRRFPNANILGSLTESVDWFVNKLKV